jgi:hypothetical protein
MNRKKYKKQRELYKSLLDKEDGQLTSTDIDLGKFRRRQLRRLRRGNSHQKKRGF